MAGAATEHLKSAAQLKSSLKTNPLAAPEMFAAKFADFQRVQVTTFVERIYGR